MGYRVINICTRRFYMFKSIKKFFGFGNSTATAVTPPAAPYKVETPVSAVPTTPVVEATVEPVVAVEPVAAPAKPKAARKPKAPAAPKAPAKPKAAKITAKAKTLKVVK